MPGTENSSGLEAYGWFHDKKDADGNIGNVGGHWWEEINVQGPC